MSNRRVSYLLLLAVVFCSASVLMVMLQMDKTRAQLQESNPGAIYYVLQTYRNLDLLQENLHDLLLHPGFEPQQRWEKARTQFDIVWALFPIANLAAPGSSEPLPAEAEWNHLGQQFLESQDKLFSDPQVPTSADVIQALQSMRPLTATTHMLGMQYFRSASRFRDEMNSRLNKLYRYLWVSASLLLLTTMLLVWWLYRLNAISRKLFLNARASEAQLTQAVDELRSGRQEQKAKDSFLAAASHDLRQPLHALGLFISALENKVVLPDGPVILDKIKQSTAALNSLFGSLLDISRLDAGVVVAEPKHFSITELLENLHEEFAEVAVHRGLSIEFNCANNIAYTDSVLLARILRNLIENAVVHSHAGTIRVSCQQNGKSLQIEVSDQGPGIPLSEQPYVFSEYYQLDNPERDRSKGLGLGLSIVKRLCELLEIEVALESTPGEGTTFTLRLPAGKREYTLERIDNENGDAQTFDFQGSLVLVIDDEHTVRDGMELILRQVNCQVLSAESADSACEKIVAEDLVPDLIIADYRLREGKTGLQAVEQVREELNEELPAFIITGDTSPERVREVSDSGMQLLHKPVVPVSLFKMINSILAKAQPEQAAP